LLLLGLLRDGPRHGYDLNRIVRAHGTLYADLGRANIYYLLDRMATEGLVDVESEAGARGNRGVRLVYRLTRAGRRRFAELLQAEMLAYEPRNTGLDVAVVLLSSLPMDEALALLRARRDAVTARRTEVAAELGEVAGQAPFARIAADHLLSLMDAELAWIDRSITSLHAADAGPYTGHPTDPST
jgi:DNA-binding PadR family transcriptional regulator